MVCVFGLLALMFGTFSVSSPINTLTIPPTKRTLAINLHDMRKERKFNSRREDQRAKEAPSDTKTPRRLGSNDPEPATERVNNGQESSPGEYPFYSQMWWSGRSQGCGGSLIASKWILTAGHCVAEFVDLIAEFHYPEWRVGAYCEKSDNCGISEELITSKRGVLHPSFERSLLKSDYALIELEKPATISPVQIDDGAVFETLQPGSTVRGLGFGFVNDDGDLPFYLQKVDNSFYPLHVCRERYITGDSFDDSMMCTNGLNYGMCIGDSGSPVMVSDPSSPYSYKQVSVSSFGGPRCGNHDIPDVSARVSTAYSWIQDTVCPTYENDSDRPHYCSEGQAEHRTSHKEPSSVCENESRFYTLYSKNKTLKCHKIDTAAKLQKRCNDTNTNALERCRKSCGVC